MLTHVVVRSFPGPGGNLSAGTKVDASGWRNAETLVRRRYLRPVALADVREGEASPPDIDAAKSRPKR